MAKTYKLRFHELAAKEWRKLAPTIRDQFQKKLRERMANPLVPSAVLHGLKDCYKIKLREVGYCLVYHVDDGIITVTVVAVGKRDNIYSAVKGR